VQLLLYIEFGDVIFMPPLPTVDSEGIMFCGRPFGCPSINTYSHDDDDDDNECICRAGCK